MSEIILRGYQEEAISNTMEDLTSGFDPVVGLPTGSGKSIVLCGLAERILDDNIHNNVLVLSHVQEILEQNHKALTKYFHGINIGLYSAGLGVKEISKITVASIQTVQNNPQYFEHFTHCIIDESHRVSFDKKTGYRKFIHKIDSRAIGLTATPYRMKGGYIYEGEKALFNKCSIDMTSGERFASLIEDGYLSEIYSKKTALTLSEEGIKTLGGDFATKDLSEKFDREEITKAAIIESIHFGKKYHHWLFFAIDIKHAEHIADELNIQGISAIAVHSKMDGREQAIADFKKGKYRALVNVDILTTGFDFPAIDMIVMLRHTKSPIIHVQSIGRGLRPHYASGYDLSTREGRLAAIEASTKTHCLVLDFAGNTKRLGPINDIKIRKKGERLKKGQMMTKTCPECTIENHLSALKCINCEHEFQTSEKIKKTAAMDDLVSKKKEKKEKEKFCGWADVKSVSYSTYEKPNKNGITRALVVHYNCGLLTFKEMIFLEGHGYGKYKAQNWIRQRWPISEGKPPHSVAGAFANSHLLKVPKRVMVDMTKRYAEVHNSEF